jgi:hypothetical protein
MKYEGFLRETGKESVEVVYVRGDHSQTRVPFQVPQIVQAARRQVVDDRDRVPLLQKSFRDVAAYETRSTGDHTRLSHHD